MGEMEGILATKALLEAVQLAKKPAPDPTDHKSITPLHSGYAEHPQNCCPLLLPLLTVRKTINLPHRGQFGIRSV
jgi:hypothetical protein